MTVKRWQLLKGTEILDDADADASAVDDDGEDSDSVSEVLSWDFLSQQTMRTSQADTLHQPVRTKRLQIRRKTIRANPRKRVRIFNPHMRGNVCAIRAMRDSAGLVILL
jgi:hypothetical protein